MTPVSTDVFAVTNPALCTLMLWSYCKDYVQHDERGCEHPLLFIPVPFALSRKVRDTLQGTNASTGFLNWVQRNPQLALDFPTLLENTAGVTRAGLMFALAHDVLVMDDEGRFRPSPGYRLTDRRLKEHAPELLEASRAAARFGTWLGQLGNTQTALHAMGVTV